MLMCGGVCGCVLMWRCVCLCVEMCAYVFGGVLMCACVWRCFIFMCGDVYLYSKLYNVGHVQRVPTFGGEGVGVAYNLSPETQLLTSKLWDHYRRLVVTVN